MQAACRSRAVSPRLDIDPKPDLDDGVLGNPEEIGGTAGDPVEERENREGYRIHRRSLVAADDGLVGDVVVLVVEIGVEAELVAVDQAERNIRGLHESESHLDPVKTVAEP